MDRQLKRDSQEMEDCWAEATTLSSTLYGTGGDLLRTAKFIARYWSPNVVNQGERKEEEENFKQAVKSGKDVEAKEVETDRHN